MIKTISIQKEIQDDAIRFGNEANLARAIPYIRDGLKPSQRYTIYTAYSHGYTSDKAHIKSLKLDGQIVGEAWPHGSEYLTIVRLLQPFVQNIPLLDGHGAFGSQLGTADPAASRYTEVRLSSACEEGLLANIKKDTIDFIPNYSEDLLLPKLLPALLPTLYVNGSDGVAFCYSQTWLPGNLNEFTEQVKNYCKNKKINYDSLAFDFPTGGIIINKKDLCEIYKTGKGTVILRGKASIENNIIKITQLPYQIYLADYLQQLKNLITSNKLSGISNIYNLSGDTGMLLELECEENPQIVLQNLYKYSNLQINLTVNQYGIIDSIPELINLETYIKIYIDHNINCLQREYTYDLNKATARLEIVDGLLKALSIIDKIIKVIKASKSADIAKQELINTFKFSEVQAKAVIDMKLGKLANLEALELQKEQEELIKIIDNCKLFLADSKLQQKEFLKRLTDFTKKFGWERRTDVCDIDFEEEKTKLIQTKEPKIPDTYMIVLENNRIKRIDIRQYKANKTINASAIKVLEDKRFILISNKGIMYKLAVKQIPKCSQNAAGIDPNIFLSLNTNEVIIQIFSCEETLPYMFFVTQNGLAKKMEAKEVFEIGKKIGTPIMKLDPDDLIIYCNVIDKLQLSVLYNNKKKIIDSDKINVKKRLSGGVCAVKVKPGLKISVE